MPLQVQLLRHEPAQPQQRRACALGGRLAGLPSGTLAGVPDTSKAMKDALYTAACALVALDF